MDIPPHGFWDMGRTWPQQGWVLGFGGTPQIFVFLVDPKKTQKLFFAPYQCLMHILLSVSPCAVSRFKTFYKAVDGSIILNLPAAWKGQLYQCVLEPDAVVAGTVQRISCQQVVKATNFATTGLRSHVRDQHRKGKLPKSLFFSFIQRTTVLQV